MQSQDWSHQKVKEIWQTACAQLELELSSGVFNTWILPNPLTQISSLDQKVIATISSPTSFHSTNLKSKLGVYLQKVLEEVIGKTIEIEYRVGIPQPRRDEQPTQNQAPVQRSSSPFRQNIYSEKNSQSPRAEDLFSEASVESAAQNQLQTRVRNIGLRADYTFKTFAVSTSNEMAHAAATAVSQNPGDSYNPLFLYGGVGVGKTHLMHAIGYNILSNQPMAKIVYSTGEEFTNQIINAIQTKKTINFKNKYRTADVLLLDDIQFIAGKNSVQEEFFHTFNALIKDRKQIVLTSDRPPHEILLLESRLRSRLEAGLMIDIQQSSFELRTAILLIKAKSLNIPVSIEMAKTIAARVDSARKIGGILNSIKSAVELRGKELNQELIDQILITEADQRRPKLNTNVQGVIGVTSNHFHLKQQAVKGKSRKQKIALARHVAMYICKEDLGESYAEIGRWFSGRDHSTVLHAYHRIQELIAEDELLQQEVSAIRMSLSG